MSISRSFLNGRFCLGQLGFKFNYIRKEYSLRRNSIACWTFFQRKLLAKISTQLPLSSFGTYRRPILLLPNTIQPSNLPARDLRTYAILPPVPFLLDCCLPLKMKRWTTFRNSAINLNFPEVWSNSKNYLWKSFPYETPRASAKLGC